MTPINEPMILLTPYQLNLRFFDLEVVLKSDSNIHLDNFARLYPRFLVDGVSASSQPAAEYAFLTGPDNEWGQPVMILDKEVWPLSNSAIPEKLIYENILYHILAQMRTHFLLHAGVVASEGQGIIIVADSFHGKTTLVLELVRRGFRFLSDETAALGRADGLVHPFPRSLRIRQGSLELTGFSSIVAEAPVGHERVILDVETLQPNSLGEAAAISNIIILQNPDEAVAIGHAVRSERSIMVRVDRLDDSLLAAIRNIDDLTNLRVVSEDRIPTLYFCTAHEMHVLSQIEHLCQEHQVLMMHVDLLYKRPAFRGPAQLETISNSQAVLELLRRFQGGHKSALLSEEFTGSTTRLYIELAVLISKANCYRLSVGRLREMADLVCSLIEPPKV